MSNEFKHKDIGTQLTQAEWEATTAHEADGETINDMLYFNGISWIRATPTTIAGLLASLAVAFSEVNLTPKASSNGAEGTIFYDSDDDHVWVATEA